MREVFDPAALTPNDRLREVGVILAAGLLRLRARAAIPATSVAAIPTQLLSESRHSELELSRRTSVTVHTG